MRIAIIFLNDKIFDRIVNDKNLSFVHFVFSSTICKIK